MAKSIYYFKMGEVPNFQLFSSQNPDLDNEQLDEIEQKAQAKNTKRATEWGVKKFEKWCEKRKITVDLKTVSLSATDLSEILRKFFAEVKTEKGQALTQSALTGIRAAIHRHLTCAPLSRNIKNMSANKMFEAKAKLLTKENNAKPKHKSSIQSGDMQKLNRYFMEGQNTDGVWKDAEKLVEFIWFSLCFHFARRGRRGREGWRELTRQSFEIKTDDTGACYISENLTEQTKNYQGGAKQSEPSNSDVRMYETSTALDLVAAFEFYLSKTHPDCKALFQTPNKATTKNIKFASTRHWYRNEPVGKNTISKAELSERGHQILANFLKNFTSTSK